MKLCFDDISVTRRRLKIDDGSWCPTDADIRLSDSVCRLSLWKENEEIVQLTGTMEGSLKGRCARCGEPVQQSLSCEFTYRISALPEQAVQEREVECTEEDAQMLFLDGSEIDLQEILREQMYLNLPYTLLCRQECRGICADCGAVLNGGECGCNTEKTSSPFAVLGKLIER
jgi:uncharacterized protein